MISTTSALRGSEVKGQGSILASPALYKDEQNGVSGLWVGCQSGGGRVVTESGSVEEGCGGRVRVGRESELLGVGESRDGGVENVKQ